MPTQKAAGERVPRKRIANGPARPRYLESRDLDRMMIMFVTLMGELSALRDRLDSHELLADAGRMARTGDVEAVAANEERLARREELRMAMVRRVFRVLMEDLQPDAPPAGPDAPEPPGSD